MVSRAKIKGQTFPDELRAGSKVAFRELFEMYGAQIFNFSLSYLQNESDAEDLLQDVFLKVWEKRKMLDSSQNIKAYIFKIAVNSIYDFIRHKNIENAYTDYARLNYKADANYTWHTLIFNEMLESLNKLVAQMPEQCRRVFHLSKRKGLTNDEIAKKLNISKRTVENQLYRAISFLKEHLESESMVALLFFYLFCD